MDFNFKLRHYPSSPLTHSPTLALFRPSENLRRLMASNCVAQVKAGS
jgi:hypothetical protein